MAATGYKNGAGQTATRQQEIRIKPAAKEAPVQEASKSKWRALMGGFLSALWNHRGSAVTAALISPALLGILQTEMERPEQNPASFSWVAKASGRALHNYQASLGAIWSTATYLPKQFIDDTDLVKKGTQPLPYAVVCINKDLDDKIRAKDPIALAYRSTITQQFDSAIHELGYRGALFYQQHAKSFPDQAPAAVFHIEDVPSGWTPAQSYILPQPWAVSQDRATAEACGNNEVFKQIPIPTMQIKR
ncbi:MAG: hypothetical protein HYS17_04755 [Micavibrio aeruginosavorus]|uniref:Uncharacterized protein n=1 Tax=Micavibrio aeruginosavorus TaxID=349221 RepID=A0A7T5R3Z1_9BACT|nr:MAG: hypothetical protein HYS17_04755 [Micavibrio aeruginosavorus]